MLKVVSWNTGFRVNSWHELVEMDADLALLQEPCTLPDALRNRVEMDPNEPWIKYDNPQYRYATIIRLSYRVSVEWFKHIEPTGYHIGEDEFPVSGRGTVAVARITPSEGGGSFIAVSMYARWLTPHPITTNKWAVGYADASAHRIISDLSAFIGSPDPASHRILAAGDLNCYYGGAYELGARDQTIFDRMQALGLEFVGPQYPNGRKPDSIPRYMPDNTQNVPIFHTNTSSPATAEYQLDYVFASRGFHESLKVRALNGVDEWGPSDHCRIVIEIAP